MKRKRRDAHECILALGWDTETAGGMSGPDRYQATRARGGGTQPIGYTTPWCGSWAEVLRHIDLTGSEEATLFADAIEARSLPR